MSTPPKILAFAGSTRRESFNRRILPVAIEGARGAGAEVTRIELADFPLPIMDQDLMTERGLPENAVRLKELFLAHHGLLIACPEYNSSITPLLKNTIDWVSRPSEGEEQLACFKGKVAGLLSASPGRLGGLRGLGTVRSILSSVGTHVIPEQMAVHTAGEHVEGERILDERLREGVARVGRRVAEVAARLAGG
jgi:NAD(P)H-dependent FMN reductase